MAELLLTVDQAAERLQLAPYTVRKHLRENKLRGIRRGRVWRVPESALTETAEPEKSVRPREEWIAAIKAARGSMRAEPGSLDRFLAAKREDVELENARLDRLSNYSQAK